MLHFNGRIDRKRLVHAIRKTIGTKKSIAEWQYDCHSERSEEPLQMLHFVQHDIVQHDKLDSLLNSAMPKKDPSSRSITAGLEGFDTLHQAKTDSDRSF